VNIERAGAGQSIDRTATIRPLVWPITVALLERLPSQTRSPPTNERQLRAAFIGDREAVNKAIGDRFALPVEVLPWPADVAFSLDELRPPDTDVSREPRIPLRRASEMVRALLAWRTVAALLIEPAHTAHYPAEPCSELRQIPTS